MTEPAELARGRMKMRGPGDKNTETLKREQCRGPSGRGVLFCAGLSLSVTSARAVPALTMVLPRTARCPQQEQ